MIKAIIFDVGGVLVHNPWPGMRDHYTSHLGVDQEKFQTVYDTLVDEWQRGAIHEKDFWVKICSKLEVVLPKSEDLWREGFMHAYQENTEVFEYIKKLKEKGYQIGLLSNTEKTVMEFLIEKKYEHFDVFVYSCGIGMIKPNRDIYEHTLEKMGVSAEEAIFVDDKKENIDGAKVIGMSGVVFANAKQLIKEIDRLLTN